MHIRVDENIPQHSPLVSIGVPVYNGAEYLQQALETLTGQDYHNLEIIICDNASSDETEMICRRFASIDSRIQYHRNPENIGPTGNFYRVLELASGKFFMWAAHDDWWDKNYISTLMEQLDSNSDAVLATPLVRHMNLDGTSSRHKNDRPAPGGGAVKNLKVFLKDHACSWIYGLYRIDWLKSHVKELDDYLCYGGDLLWLIDIMLRYKVVGSDVTCIYKRVGKSYCTPKSETEQLQAWWHILSRMTWLSRNRPERVSEKLWSTLMCWRYCYRKYVRRGNPFKQLKRFGQIAGAAMSLMFRREAEQATEVSSKEQSSEITSKAA